MAFGVSDRRQATKWKAGGSQARNHSPYTFARNVLATTAATYLPFGKSLSPDDIWQVNVMGPARGPMDVYRGVAQGVYIGPWFRGAVSGALNKIPGAQLADKWMLAGAYAASIMGGAVDRSESRSSFNRGVFQRGDTILGKLGGLLLDAADIYVTSWGLPTVNGMSVAQGAAHRNSGKIIGHSLGAADANNLVAWGFAESAEVYALPFYQVGGTNVRVTQGLWDPVVGSWLAPLLNPFAHRFITKPGTAVHMSCPAYGVGCN